MVDKIKRISSRNIILFTALALVASFVISGLYGFVTEAVARKNGSLVYSVLIEEDFVRNGIEYKEGHLVTTDNDPQLLLETNQKFTSLKFYMESSIYPGEMVVYYTEPGDTGFSVQKRLWIVPAEQRGWYIVETGMKNITSLRVDPTIYAGNVLRFGDFEFNREKTVGEYFEISYGDVFNLIVYTGIISSVLKFLLEIVKKEID